MFSQTNNQQPTTNNQQPTTNNQQPVIPALHPCPYEEKFYLRPSISSSMKSALLIPLLFLSFITIAQTYSGPESVEYDYAARRWLIANTSSHQVLSRDSSGTLSVFASGLGSGPYGIEIVGDTLFCCSGSSIKGFLLSSGAPVFTLNVGASFLNGLTHDDSGNLIATDFSAKKIFKVNIAAQTFSAIASNMTNTPNGIVFDGANNRCVIVTWGSNAPILGIDMVTYALSTILPTTLSSCDGITRDGSGRYYVSTWGTQSIVRFDSSFSAPPLTVADSLSSPADIFYNVVGDSLAVPNSGNNTVTFIGFPSTVGLNEQSDELAFSIYPNPVASGGDIHVLMEKNRIGKFELFNAHGQIISSASISNSASGKWNAVTFGTGDLKKGIYFLRLVSDAHQWSKAFLVE
ncbi:MAG TPA: T9SS type A sorting domain-containing protein [Bacteroidia bacterium]|nr:T9SS type A sorting domain-containing protein [Bacteroidia bacterium]